MKTQKRSILTIGITALLIGILAVACSENDTQRKFSDAHKKTENSRTYRSSDKRTVSKAKAVRKTATVQRKKSQKSVVKTNAKREKESVVTKKKLIAGSTTNRKNQSNSGSNSVKSERITQSLPKAKLSNSDIPKWTEFDSPQLVRMAICSDVDGREPVDKIQTVIAGGKIYTHTAVACSVEDTVQHVYKMAGKELARVPLFVGPSPRWRTWSSKNIAEDWAGEIFVEIQNAEGDVLASQSIQIEPANKQSGKKELKQELLTGLR